MMLIALSSTSCFLPVFLSKMIRQTGYLFLFILGLAFSSELRANDTIQLKPVQVSTTRLKLFSKGSSYSTIDSVWLPYLQGLSTPELLRMFFPVMIRDLGSGSLATLSIRGCSAAQSAVTWEGITLNSPGTGDIDINLIPSGAFNDYTLLKGGQGAILGSSAQGGALQLGQTTESINQIGYNTSSLGKQNVFLNSKVKLGRLSIGNSISYDYNPNNFTYVHAIYKTDTPNKHALNKAFNYLPSIEYATNNSLLYAKAWVQQVYREIPPTMVMNSNDAVQGDSSYRWSMGWKYNKDKHYFETKLASVTDYFRYREQPVDSKFKADRKIIGAEYRYTLGRNKFSIEAQSTRYWADNMNYGGNVTEWRSNVNAAVNRIWNANNYSSVFIRKDIVKSISTPLVYGLGHEYYFKLDQLGVKANVNRIFQIPTLNQRYWIPGGNINLKPELGWSVNMAMVLKSKREKLSITAEAGPFLTDIKNYLLWIPKPGAGYYYPTNNKRIRNYGLEANIKLEYSLRSFQLLVQTDYQYLKAQNIEVYEQSDINLIDKQLIYQPLHSARNLLMVNYKSLNMYISHTYNGLRYDDYLNTIPLKAYNLFDAQVGYRLGKGKRNVVLSARVKNLMNTSYQSVRYWAMPGRNYNLSLIINL